MRASKWEKIGKNGKKKGKNRQFSQTFRGKKGKKFLVSCLAEIVACEHEISANGLQPGIEQVSTGILLTMLG